MTKSTTTVALDREVVREAKVLAAKEGITLKTFVERSMLLSLTQWPKPQKPRRAREAVASS